MPLTIRDLRGLEGPNVYYGQPCVKFELWADHDIARTIGDTIKAWAQATGLVIGSLHQDVQPADDGVVILTTFLTPFPLVGEKMCEEVFADLVASDAGDEEYSHDEQLFEVIRELKRESPDIKLLQIHAEARAHELRLLPRTDGTLMIGSGKRGFVFDPAPLSMGMEVEIPWDTVGRIPIVAVTGTNGKTTTVRMISHVLASVGLTVGHTDTDGVYIGGDQVETGDWAGFDGARLVLTDKQVDVAVLETARGSILRRGLAFNECDVGVLTNVSADHLHELGIETPADMARVKGVVALATRQDGFVVLNADDPLVWELRTFSPATPIAFTQHPDSGVVEQHRAANGPVVSSDGATVLVTFGQQRDSFALSDVFITFGGRALHNVENLLAATGACVALGIPVTRIAAALHDFGKAPSENLGRLNVFRNGDRRAVLDYAHNQAGIAMLLGFGEQLRQETGGQLVMMLGGPGDRPDDQIEEQGRRVGAHVDRLLIHEEGRYLRGRAPGEVPDLYRRGAVAAGLAPNAILIFPDELTSLTAALTALGPSDTLLIAAHTQRTELIVALEHWQAGDDRPLEHRSSPAA